MEPMFGEVSPDNSSHVVQAALTATISELQKTSGLCIREVGLDLGRDQCPGIGDRISRLDFRQVSGPAGNIVRSPKKTKKYTRLCNFALRKPDLPGVLATAIPNLI